MIVGDVLRAALYLSIPADLSLHFVNPLTWIYVVQFVASSVSLFWTSAKDASVPNLVPPDKLEQAYQYSLFTTFGTALPAGLIFSLLSWPTGRSAALALLHHPPGEPGAVLQHRHVRGLRAYRLRAARDPQAPVQRAHLRPVDGQDHLGGLEVHRETQVVRAW